MTDPAPSPLPAPVPESDTFDALRRVGVVDIGSNSVRLVVFDGAARSPAYFYNEKIMCGLGAGMSETGRLHAEGRYRALEAMRRFHLLARGMGVPELTAVATAAVREASDGADFCADVKRETGIDIRIIDGEEEARLSAQGVLLGWPGSYGLVCDIGGSSMELAEISGGAVGKRMTSPLGPLKLRDLAGGAKAREREIKARLRELMKFMGEQRNRLFLVGGSWRAIARIDMERQAYPLHVLHEYRMDAAAVRETVKMIGKADLEDLRSRCGLSSSRMALVPLAAEVLERLVQEVRPNDIAISSYGIREGLLFEQMPQALRDRDPLIEACRFAEAKDARQPGFGAALFHFVEPLFAGASPARLRLVRAACLLHDVSWRAHPDYRAEVCFDYATRSNLGGLRHFERLFLGLALHHRYKNKRDGSRFEELFDLLNEADTRDAEILGKAMRFGAMLWIPAARDPMARIEWFPADKRLIFRIETDSHPLYGEVAQARLSSLASSLDATIEVVET